MKTPKNPPTAPSSALGSTNSAEISRTGDSQSASAQKKTAKPAASAAPPSPGSTHLAEISRTSDSQSTSAQKKNAKPAAKNPSAAAAPSPRSNYSATTSRTGDSQSGPAPVQKDTTKPTAMNPSAAPQSPGSTYSAQMSHTNDSQLAPVQDETAQRTPIISWSGHPVLLPSSVPGHSGNQYIYNPSTALQSPGSTHSAPMPYTGGSQSASAQNETAQATGVKPWILYPNIIPPKTGRRKYVLSMSEVVNLAAVTLDVNSWDIEWAPPETEESINRDIIIAIRSGVVSLYPNEANPRGEFYCLELDGRWTKRTLNTIKNDLNPGHWAYGKSYIPFWIRQPQE